MLLSQRKTFSRVKRTSLLWLSINFPAIKSFIASAPRQIRQKPDRVSPDDSLQTCQSWLAWTSLHLLELLRVVYMKQPKSVWFLLSDQFYQAICLIFVSIWLTNITLHKIGQRERKIPISKSVGEPGKIGQTAWQNWSDMPKIRSTTVRVNGALKIFSPCTLSETS